MFQYDNILKSPLQIGFNVAGPYFAKSFADTSAYSRAASVAIGSLGSNYIHNSFGFAIGDELVTNPLVALSRIFSNIAKGKGSIAEYEAAGAAGYGTYQATGSLLGEASTEAVATTEAAETSGILGIFMEGLEFLPLLII